MRNLAWGVVLIALAVGCGNDKKDEAKGSAVASGTGTASGTSAAVVSGTATAKAADCAAACEHRKGCGIEGDVAACTKDCDGLAELLGDKAPNELATYIAADCAAVTQGEVGFAQATACIRGCKHALECGVVGTYPACFVECGTNLENKQYTVADLEKITAADCETVKKTVKLTPPASTASGGGGGTNWREAEAEALFRRNPRFPMCNDHNDCGGSVPVCCRQQFHSSCVSACF